MRPESVTTIPAIPALPAIPVSEVEQTEYMEYSSSSTYSPKVLHSIYYSSIPPLPVPKNYQKECIIRYFSYCLKCVRRQSCLTQIGFKSSIILLNYTAFCSFTILNLFCPVDSHKIILVLSQMCKKTSLPYSNWFEK